MVTPETAARRAWRSSWSPACAASAPASCARSTSWSRPSRSRDGPVYVRKEIIHNRYVVDELRRKGAVFVEDVDEVPDGSWLIYSAHGVSPTVRDAARKQAAAHDRRDLPARDEGPPRSAPLREEGLHDRPDRPRGARRDDRHARRSARTPSASSAPGQEAETVEVPDPDRVAYLTQTTLSLDDTREIVEVLKRRFPKMASPAQGRHLLRDAEPPGRGPGDGAPRGSRSSCSGRPTAPTRCASARSAGRSACRRFLIERAADIRPEWLAGVRVLGLTASASAPEILVREVVDYTREKFGVRVVEEFETVQEDVNFPLPVELKGLLQTRRPDLL